MPAPFGAEYEPVEAVRTVGGPVTVSAAAESRRRKRQR